MKKIIFRPWLAALVGASVLASGAMAQSRGPIDPDKERVIKFWTKERRAAAIPRDLFIDERGLGYLKHPSGFLQPYGHDKPAVTRGPDPTPSPFGKPSGGGDDTTPPVVSGWSPGNGDTIGGSATFSATVTDEGGSGVSRVDFVITGPSGFSQTFRPSQSGETETWSITLNGFTNGSWSWYVKARDGARNNSGNEVIGFSVDTTVGSDPGGSGSTDGVVTNSQWTDGGAVQR
ncbi:MAG: Ig-like domain-containing protein, partial [Quisquiliibacterium sp.]